MGPGAHPPIDHRKSGRACRGPSQPEQRCPLGPRDSPSVPRRRDAGSALPREGRSRATRACQSSPEPSPDPAGVHGAHPRLAITRAPRILAVFPLHGLGVVSGKVAQRRACAGKRAGGRGRTERGSSFRAWGPCRLGLSQAEPHGWEFLETGAVGQGVAGATGSVLGPRVQRLNPRELCPGVCGLQASMAGPDPCSGLAGSEAAPSSPAAGRALPRVRGTQAPAAWWLVVPS